MTKFGDWIREWAAHVRLGRGGVGLALDGQQLDDLANLTAQLEEAASPFAANQDQATDPRVGLTQPVTVAEAEALNAALAACKEFMERHE